MGIGRTARVDGPCDRTQRTHGFHVWAVFAHDLEWRKVAATCLRCRMTCHTDTLTLSDMEARIDEWWAGHQAGLHRPYTPH